MKASFASEAKTQTSHRRRMGRPRRQHPFGESVFLRGPYQAPNAHGIPLHAARTRVERGVYGRSERGTRPLSHPQFAEDAALVIKDIFKSGETVDVIGFSEGAITSYILASSHPELVRRLVAIGRPLGAYGAPIEDLESDEELTPELMQQQVPDLVARRKKQMTHPEQWDQLIRDLNAMYDRMVYAFDRATFTMSMKPKAGGETQEMGGRVFEVLRKEGGKWKSLTGNGK